MTTGMTAKILMLLREKWRGLLCAAFLISHFSFLICPAKAQGLPLIHNFTVAEYGGHNRCYDIEIGSDGTVFVANFEGLLYYDRSRWRIIYTPDISRTTVVYRDSGNTIWVGGFNFFARVQQNENGELFMEQVGRNGLFKGEVLEIMEDNGHLEFLVSDNNIYEVKGDKQTPTVELKQHLKTDSDINANSEITQVEPLDGGLQVKVKKGNGLIIADGLGHDLYVITEDNGLCSNQVAYVAYDGHGLLWGATQHGIFAIELPSLYSYFLVKDGLAGEVHTMKAFDGKIYVGGSNGLFAIKDRQLIRIHEIGNICWKLQQGREGLLAATSSGIYKIMHGGSVSRMTSSATTAMLVDGDRIYAGESDGVWLYQAGQRRRVNDLPHATEISRDGNGGLWCQNVNGQTVGTAPAKKREPLEELPPQLLRPVSGFEATAQYRDGNHIWIGGDEIIAMIDMDKKDLSRLSDCRTVRFRSIIMGNDSVLWGGYGDMPARLPKLRSDERHLHFYYALDYTPLSGSTLYRYRLNNTQWSAWTDRRDAEFVNLSYGAYTFTVQARLANGELSEVASIDFSIAYPLLMRWYMVVLYFLILSYIAFLLFRYRLKRLQKEKDKLEQIVEERTADLRNAQHELIRQEKMATVGKLTGGLVDRILNPMNYIINFSKMSINLLKDLSEDIESNKDSINENDYEDTQDVIGMLKENLQNLEEHGQNTTRMLKAMEEMLKDRTGGYTDMDLRTVLQQNEQMLDGYFAKDKEQYHITTVFTLPDEAMPLHGNPNLLSKTFMSLLSNAIYAVVKKAQKSACQPEVSLTVTIADGHYILKMRDNGIGIEEKILGKIFDPFFTTKTTGEAAGVGLYLSREIIQNHGGDISVESVKDEYTEFTITLPQQQSK